MAFIVGAVIGGAAALGGAAIASSGAKKAANAAAAGSQAEIAYNRETRDLIRQDQEPYREAGYTALDALMSMTGLESNKAAPQEKPILGRIAQREEDAVNTPYRLPVMGGERSSSYTTPFARYAGGPTSPNVDYNVSELGPENVFTKGRVVRHQRPVTIDGETGYVEPNIQGRYAGGNMEVGLAPPPKLGPPGSQGYDTPPVGPPKVPQPTQTGIDPNTGYPVENPGGTEGGFNFKTDPGYEFRFKEGMRALDRGAAASGGLLSGGYGRKAIRYGQDYASGEYTNVYNRIANIAGLGQTANQTNANAALMTGANMGSAASDAGYARASGYQAAGNAWANAGNQIAQLPWGNVFNKNTDAPIGRGP